MEVFDAPSHYYPSDAMSLDELAYWIAFNPLSGIGPVSFKSLLDYYHNDLQAAWRGDTKELAQAGLTQKTIENVIKLRTTSTPQRELEKLEQLRIRVITVFYRNTPHAGFRQVGVSYFLEARWLKGGQDRLGVRPGYWDKGAVILEALNLFMVPQQLELQAVLPDNDDERLLLKLISLEPCHIDELIRESGLPTTTVSSTLTMMELKGMVKQVGGMQYVLAR